MRALLTSLQRHPVALIAHTFVAFSVGWTITEILSHFFGWPWLKDPTWLATLTAISIAYSLYKIWQPSRIEFGLPMSSLTIEVQFGDIFILDGVTAIPVNEFFDSELGMPVSPHSLHGIFLTNRFGGHPSAFDLQVTKELASLPSETVVRPVGKSKKYSIGTTALVTTETHRYLAFAFTHSDPLTCKVSADVAQVFVALAGLWARARIVSNGEAVNVPLVGSGLSGVNLPTRELINAIVLSFIHESRRQIVTPRLRIVLTPDRRAKVNLRDIQRYWEDR